MPPNSATNASRCWLRSVQYTSRTPRCRNHAQAYPLYDALRRRFDCDMNFDLNRLARSTSAASVQGLSGKDARDIPAAVARLLAHTRADRIVTCSPADYLAFKAYSGRETLFITECLR